jgi:hypothetical protein
MSSSSVTVSSSLIRFSRHNHLEPFPVTRIIALNESPHLPTNTIVARYLQHYGKRGV